MGKHCYNINVQSNVYSYINSKPEEVLKDIFGYKQFRPFQKEIIDHILLGIDTLAIMPTGGGKSICYQIPALIFSGITVVVSPLISLMQDQVDSLKANGIYAAFLNSTLTPKEYNNTVTDILQNKIKIVYVSPEGLSTNKIRTIFTQNNLNVNCITIDEAHCISQWGHDFRPDYLNIQNFRKLFPNAVTLALTATATPTVRDDIIKILSLKQTKVFIASFNRDNIFLKVVRKQKPLEQILECLERHKNESGIIYCLSRKTVEELSENLQNLHYSVLPYHAGLADNIKKKNQDLFVKDKTQIIVATIAFGMGINKPNVRFVINYDLPKSIEEYYQEIGRAGRDGLYSEALLLFSPADIYKNKFLLQESNNPEYANLLLQKMADYCTSKICRRKNLLAYFGESYVPTKQEECCCDICSNQTNNITDVTIPVQKLLCCILRTYERYGAAYIIDILLGIENSRILENNHDTLSTWGIGTELSKNDWFELINTLITEDYIIKYGKYNVLKLTNKAKHALMTKEQINLSFQKKQTIRIQKKSSMAQTPQKDDLQAEKILAELKLWRTRKANDLNVPPYIIFGDKSLMDLAAKKPLTKMELKNVYGLGAAKIERFGNSILRIISDNLNI